MATPNSSDVTFGLHYTTCHLGMLDRSHHLGPGLFEVRDLQLEVLNRWPF